MQKALAPRTDFYDVWHKFITSGDTEGVPDPKKPGSERIMAFIRPTDEYKGKLTAEGIIATCKEHLPAYAVPKYVEFKDDLPITVTMKLFKKELREEAVAKMKERGEIE